MSYEAFVEAVEYAVNAWVSSGKIFPPDGQPPMVTVLHRTGYNGRPRDAVTIRKEGCNSSPVAYLDSYFTLYERGISVGEIARQICVFIRDHYMPGKINTRFFSSFEEAGKGIICRVLNYEMNRKLLEDIPYRRFLDLAVVYYMQVPDDLISNASILIRNEHIQYWGTEEKELYEKAWQNMMRTCPWQLFEMGELIGDAGICKEEPLYVLTNSTRHFGAVWMTWPETLACVAGKIGEEYYVLPSSVHEVILVPSPGRVDVEELQDMVRTINRTEVEEEDRLADSVYRYSVQEGSLRLAV